MGHPELLSSSALPGSSLCCACCVRHVISCVFSPTFLVSISILLLRLSLLPQCFLLLPLPLFPFSFFTFPLSLRVRFFSLCLSPRSICNSNLFLFFFFSFFPPLLPSHQQCIRFSLLFLLLLFLQTFLRVLADADRTLFRVSSAKRRRKIGQKKENSFTNGDREEGKHQRHSTHSPAQNLMIRV